MVYLPTSIIKIHHPCRYIYQSHGSYGGGVSKHPPDDVSVVDESRTPSLLLEFRGVLAHLLFLLPKLLHGPDHQQKHGVFVRGKIEKVGRNTDIVISSLMFNMASTMIFLKN